MAKCSQLKKILLIDDIRDLTEDFRPHDFVIARTYDSGIFLLKNHQWDLLLLDHDLGCFKLCREYTGYDVMCWLEEHPEHLPGRIELVTSNPAGRKKMQQVINKLYIK